MPPSLVSSAFRNRKNCIGILDRRTFTRHVPRRTNFAAPKAGATLMNYRSDRDLPEIVSPWRPWLRTLPIFIAIMTVSALGIFNYQKQQSSVISATLYALRTSEVGRRELGDEIYFRDMWPWIWGELNSLHGRIDISYGVKGTKGSGMMRFNSVRKKPGRYFETIEWTLQMQDGRMINLLDDGRSDPLMNIGDQQGGVY